MNAKNRPSIGLPAFANPAVRCVLTFRGGRWLAAFMLGAVMLVSGLACNARSDVQPALAAIVVERAPETLSEAERLIALYRFVQEDIRQIDARYG